MELDIKNLGNHKVAPKQVTFDTQKNKEDLSFWYEYKPFINVDDGTIELEIKHDFLHSEDLEQFDFNNPQIDPVDLSQSMVKLMRKEMGYGLAANQVGLPLKVFRSKYILGVLKKPDEEREILFK